MNRTLEILCPDRRVKLDSGREIIVRELSWKELKLLLARITDQLATVVTAAESFQSGVSLGSITSLIKDSQELCEAIVEKTTSLTPEEVSALRVTELFAILDVALELNLQSISSGAKKAFGRITSFVGKSAAGTTMVPTATNLTPSPAP
jgi:hypothetical protein